MRKKIVPLLVFGLLITGCSSSSDESGSPQSKTNEDINWINSCERDYKSFECKNAIEEMIRKQEGGYLGLYAELEPYEDPEKNPICLKDPESSECGGLRLLQANTMTDLTCEEVKAFGFGYFCYAELILWNKGSAPIDDFFEASIRDTEGRKFAADVEGEFRFGVMNIEYSDSFKIDLNPGKFIFVHYAFSVPDKDLIFRSLEINSYDSSFYMPLCLKTRGDGSDYDKDKVRIFEHARLLNSCTFNFDTFTYDSRPAV